MQITRVNDIAIHWREDGDPNGAPVVFSNSLGTDFRLWDKIIPLMPSGLRLIRYDKRGHGLSEGPAGPYKMDTLIEDAGLLLDHLEIRDSVFVGLSIGGIIAQGLAEWRPDLVRAMVISNTAAKIGNTDMWAERIAAVEAGGVEAIADPTMERWFSKTFRSTEELNGWRNMLTRTDKAGYIGCMHAIAGTDMLSQTAGLRLATLGIAGSEDGSTPPDLVRETTDLIPGSRFHLIKGAGHLPCVENPVEYADTLTTFLTDVGHV